ncbi:hypothetical protein SAMN02745866_02449 [Alteromonadaceae bacterium Bs31]|nr:hypothetical protein SAMN02745866_02449 [Alteromonadaceae bacterium Bs31]
MIIRRAADRGVANFDWLNSHHTFSFGHYYDPRHMGFGPLRVINDDTVDAGAGFPPHGHADMEIVSYVVAGGLEHKDSIGSGSLILPGDVQRMSAGKGIRHSEYNTSKTERVRFLQIWVVPETKGIAPGYEQKHFFESAQDEGVLKLVGSRQGREGSITIHQDVDLYAARVKEEGASLNFDAREGRKVWVQMVNGELSLNGEVVKEGDGIAFEGAQTLHFGQAKNAEFLLFDMTGSY